MFGRPAKSLSVLSTSILYTVVKERAEAGASTGKSCLVLAGALRAAFVRPPALCARLTGWLTSKINVNDETRVDFR